jgi:hypothetical protein
LEISFMPKTLALFVALPTLLAPPALAASQAECSAPAGFKDTPPPAIEPAELVSHVEEITIDRPLAAVLAAENKTSLERAMHGTSTLPGVVGTHVFIGRWSEPGARRVTCLSDGGTTEEQVILNDRTQTTHHFRYEVWNYTTPQAKPVDYAVGDFMETDLGDGRTRIVWTYSFRLKPGEFPGNLGPPGRALFQKIYLDNRYAQLMRGALAVRKADAEQAQPTRDPR